MKNLAFLLFCLFITTNAYAEQWNDVYGGYNSDGEKKYIKWKGLDIVMMTGHGIKEVSKFIYKCIDSEAGSAWYDSRVTNLKNDEDRILLTIKTKWILDTEISKVLIEPMKGNKQRLRCL